MDQTECKECLVSLTEAKSIGVKHELTTISTRASNPNLKSLGNSLGKFENIKAVTDSNNIISYYIINYKGGGFLILSADKRVKPVLAYSNESSFPIDKIEYPEGIVDWLESSKKYVAKVRNSKSKLTSDDIELWSDCMISRVTKRPPLEDGECIGGCPNTSYTRGPLLKTEWAQGQGFNAQVPFTGCTGNAYDRALVGCVAVAMAQVMKYHQYPNTFNWNAMDNIYATAETARLMADIGASDGVNMTYGCIVSGAYSEDIAGALKRKYKYSSANFGDFNSATVKSEISNGRPVLLSGKNLSKKEGHAWVADGYRSDMIYSSDCNNSWTYLYLHMNWGWGGYSDGYYSFDNWTGGGSSFNDNKKMTYNIKP